MSTDRASESDAAVLRARSELSLDLGGEVLSLMRLLFAADLMPAGGLYTGAWAQTAVRRYLRLWLPLLSHHPDPAERESLIPPVDVALVWMLHRALDIHAYVDDCNIVALSSAAALGLPTDREPELLGAGPEQALGFGDGEGAVGAFSAEVWQEWSQIVEEGRASPQTLAWLPVGPTGGQPYWPPQLPAAGTGGGASSSSRRPGPEAWEEELQGRLVSALPHASWLLRRLLACGFDGSPQHLEIALDRYCRFLLLAQRHAHEALLPPPDVLAVWWAHKAHLGAYLADMDVVMGGPFDMALTLADLEDVELAAYTAQMYERQYGLAYDPPYSPNGTCPPLPPHPFARHAHAHPQLQPQPFAQTSAQTSAQPAQLQSQQQQRLLQDALGRRLEWEAAAGQLAPLRTFFDSGALLMARLTTTHSTSMSTSRNRVAAAAGVAWSGAPTSPACAPLTPSLHGTSSVGVGGAASYQCLSMSQRQQAQQQAQLGPQRQGRGSAGGSQPLCAAAEAALAAAGGGGWECPSPGNTDSSGSSTSGSSGGSVVGAPQNSSRRQQRQQQPQQQPLQTPTHQSPQQDKAALPDDQLAPPSPPPQQAGPLLPQQLSPVPGGRPHSRSTPLAKLGSALRDLLHRSRHRSRRRRSVSANGFPGVTAGAGAGSGGAHPATVRGALSWRQDSAAGAAAAASGGGGAAGACGAAHGSRPPGGQYPTHSGEMAAGSGGGGGERGSRVAAGPHARASQEVLARALTVDVCPGGGGGGAGSVPTISGGGGTGLTTSGGGGGGGGGLDDVRPDWARPSPGLAVPLMGGNNARGLPGHGYGGGGGYLSTGPLVNATGATRATGSPMPSSGGFTVAAALAAAAAADASAAMLAAEAAAPASSPFPARSAAVGTASATAPGGIGAPSSAPFASTSGAAAARAAAGSPSAAREAAARQQRASYSGAMGATLLPPASPQAPASTPLAAAGHSQSQERSYSQSQTQSHCYSHSYSAYGGMPATRTTSAGWSGPFGPGGGGGAAAGLPPMTPSPTGGPGATSTTTTAAASAAPASAPLVLPLCSEVLAMFQETAVAHGPAVGAPPGSRPRSSLGLRGSFCGGAAGSGVLPSAMVAVHVPRAGTELRYLLWLAEKALPAAEAEAAAALERRHSTSASSTAWRAAAVAALAAASGSGAVAAHPPAGTAQAVGSVAAAATAAVTPGGAAGVSATHGTAPTAAGAAATGNTSAAAASSLLRRHSSARSRAGFVRWLLSGLSCGLAGGGGAQRRRANYMRRSGGSADMEYDSGEEQGEEPGALMRGGGPSAIAARWSAVTSMSSAVTAVPPAAASAPPSGLAVAGGGGGGALSRRRVARRYRKAVACALARAVVRQAAGFGTFAHLPMRSDHPFWEETLMGGFHYVSGGAAAAAGGSAGSSAYPPAAAGAGASAGAAGNSSTATATATATAAAATAAAAALAASWSGAVSGRPWLLAPWVSPRLRGVVLRGRAWRLSLERAIAASPRP